MSNINAFRGPKDVPCQISTHSGQYVVHKKMILKGFCFINLYKIMPPREWPLFIPRPSFEQKLEFPCARGVPC